MKTRKRITACLLMAAMLLSPESIVEARTDAALDDYEDIVGTYSIDDTMLSYEEYAVQFGNVKPAETYVVDAADYVRFTDGTTDAAGNEVEGGTGTFHKLRRNGRNFGSHRRKRAD